MEPLRERLFVALRTLAAQRGPGSSFCPSEAARMVAEDWRPVMPLAREVAAELVAADELRCTQRRSEVGPKIARGPIRLRRR